MRPDCGTRNCCGCSAQPLLRTPTEVVVKTSASSSQAPAEPGADHRRDFPQGGTYVLGDWPRRAFFRCVDYLDRPGHADQLHLDLWWDGVNLACDAGTYLYNGLPPWNNSLAFTRVHNTVTLDGQDQMTRASRFLWVRWARGLLRYGAGSEDDQLEFL